MISSIQNIESLRKVKRQARAELFDNSYYEFFKYFWKVKEPVELADNWHIEYLCDEVQKVGERVINWDPLEYNLIINISPGESKSSIVTVYFPVWLWTRDPSIRQISASYSSGLSLLHASFSRDIIQLPQFQEIYEDRFQIRKDMKAKGEYGVSLPDGKPGGVRFSTSVGGTITGKHARIIFVDDPLNPQQAKSDAERETANLWMGSTVNSRKVDENITPTILIMQRVHEDDPTGTLEKDWGKIGKLKHIRLPADNRYTILPPELEEKYTQQDELKVMNPKRKPEKVIRRNESTMTAEDFSGQYGQDPQPAEGNKLKKAWFENRFNISSLDSMIAMAPDNHYLREKITWNATLDGAYTKVKSNSATGVLIWGQWKKKLYLRDYREWWLEFHELTKMLKPFLYGQGFAEMSTLFVEPKAIGKSVVQVLRSEGGINVVEDPLPVGITQMESKIVRVDRSTPYIRGMNLHLNEAVDWEPFIKQCATFPNASHTDLVDVLCMACEKVDYVSLWEDMGEDDEEIISYNEV